MTTSQNDPNKPVMDEVDDLTRFLDEDFATDEVDLFEFTTGDEESPLTQLKTIILGLDWEITDEALQDLADEIEHLRSLDQFQSDKVSQVYLQALDKIGSYLLSEGAYAHHNAIKLLLTMFYDFEKITSSELITGAEITALLKADVRKFKILQYQIAQKHGTAAPEAAAAAAELPLTDHKTLLDLHAAILELDWDVNDDSLKGMAEQLEILKEQFSDNRYIQILLRGLSTLNRYIDEERARTHPEAFSLLHHFFEALENLVDDKDLDEEGSQKLLISCVNRLNTLKALITQTPQELDQEAVRAVPEGGEQAEAPAPESVEAAKEPVAEAPVAAPAQEDEYEDELDVELPTDETGEVAPALSDSADEGGGAAVAEEEAPPEELAEKLDFFFGGDEEIAESAATAEEPVAEEQIADESAVAEEPAAEAPAGSLAAEEGYEDELDVELPVDEAGEVAPALADSGEEGGGTAVPEEEAPPEELAEKLDFFFGSDEEIAEPAAAETEETVAEGPIAEESPVAEEPAAEPPAGSLAAEKEYEDELDVELPMDDSGEVAPALADSGEQEDSVETVAAEEAPPEELTERLDSFFGSEEEVFAPEAVEEDFARKTSEEEEREAAAQLAREEEEEGLSVSPALTGEPEEGGFTGEPEEAPPEGLDEKLDFFFGEEEEAEVKVEPPEEASVEELSPVVEEETPEALFEEEEEEVLLTPELAADEEQPDELAALSTPDDFKGFIQKIQAEFREREQSLLDEIASLKKEIESLRS